MENEVERFPILRLAKEMTESINKKLVRVPKVYLTGSAKPAVGWVGF